MKLQQLKYLLAIADNGLNITAAAERLYTSQPGVSKQLKLLEEELGIQIFTRKGKSLGEITLAGQKIIDRARIIMQEVDNIRALAADFYEEEEGALTIATTHTQARYVLPDIVKAFRERYPNIRLDLHQGTSEQIADMVDANRIDFAIATGSRELFGNLLMVPSYRWERTIIVPRDHELTRLERKLELSDLAKFPLVSYVFSFSGESSLKRAFEDKDLEPDVVFTARDADVIKTYVRMGMGVGIVAAMADECGDRDDLVRIDASGLFPVSTTWIGFRKDAVLRRYMQAFLKLFAPHVSDRDLDDIVLTRSQASIDTLYSATELPQRRGCEDAVVASGRVAAVGGFLVDPNAAVPLARSVVEQPQPEQETGDQADRRAGRDPAIWQAKSVAFRAALQSLIGRLEILAAGRRLLQRRSQLIDIGLQRANAGSGLCKSRLEIGQLGPQALALGANLADDQRRRLFVDQIGRLHVALGPVRKADLRVVRRAGQDGKLLAALQGSKSTIARIFGLVQAETEKISDVSRLLRVRISCEQQRRGKQHMDGAFHGAAVYTKFRVAPSKSASQIVQPVQQRDMCLVTGSAMHVLVIEQQSDGETATAVGLHVAGDRTDVVE